MERMDERYSKLHISNIILNVISIITFFFDNATDIIVMMEYFSLNLINQFCLMFTFLVIPSAILQFFSLSWFYDSKGDGQVGVLVWMTHGTFMSLLHRYVLTLVAAVKARSSNGDIQLYNDYYQHQSGVSILRMFDAFLHSAPLFILQVHIMLTRHQWSYWTGLSAGTALISLSWSIATYNRDMRNARTDKNPLSCPGIILLTLWRTGCLTSRMISLVLFARVLPYTTFSIMSLHWFCMFLWIYHQKTDFCDSKWEERIYNGVAAVVYCFCFFNLKEGKSRYRLLTFYCIIFIQNSIFISSYLYFSSFYNQNSHDSLLFTPFYKIMLVSICAFSFVFGIANMALYYSYFHPSGRIYLCSTEKEDEGDKESESKVINQICIKSQIKRVNDLNQPPSLRLKYKQSFTQNTHSFNI